MNHGEIPPGLEVDHIDGDRRNNKIENLRLASRSENMMNQRKARADSRSRVLGVRSRGNGWQGRIKVHGMEVARNFKTQRRAMLWVEHMRRVCFGEFHSPNALPGLAEPLA